MPEDSMFTRTRAVLGPEALDTLKKAHVAVFGLGGVGGSCAEALARGGVGRLTLVDHDVISLSNLNRQTLALRSTLGQQKAEVCKARLLDINPDLIIHALPLFYDADQQEAIDFSTLSAVADCVDTLSAKMLIAKKAQEAGVPLVSCLGAGNRLDATMLCFADIYDTAICPLARRMRKACREAGLEKLRVLYSRETPVTAVLSDENGRHPPGSVSFVPPVAGIIIAGDLIKTLLGRP